MDNYRMIKYLCAFIAFSIFASFSCVPNLALAMSKGNPAASVTPLPEAVGQVKAVPDMYYNTRVEAEKIISSSNKMNEVLKSDCLYEFLKNRKMIQTNGKPSFEIAKEVKSASGSIPVQWYYSRFTSAVAYRNVGSPIIHFNRKYFSFRSSDCDIANTMAHESVGHVILGYGHDFNWNKTRDFSVPYSLNKGFDVCCK